ncbi:MAG: Rpp14/Pop5 family protein [Candidatus Burarchaeum sp.]|nr:Rpp14/Pop5 family protein [Candidatus Burarchaeum sp.]MDO8339537.1 Rpp14/Pop5 family protein [Candidatus Burarchaeum sp.]
MTLKPSMREKWRYVSFRLEVEGELSASEAKDGIEKGVIRFLGELGASIAKPKVLEYGAQEREGIVRCETAGVGGVRAALALINNLGGKRCAVRTLKTSGTIAGLGVKHR